MKVSVVVINWNGAEKLKKYLPEILKIKDVDEFIVTDDASTDNSIKVLEEQFPEVTLVKRSQNGGFSSNANSGVKAAKGDLVFLLNPDAVPDKECVTKALPYFQDPKVFSVGCNTGGNWSWAKWEKGFFWHYMDKGPVETHQTLWARGGSGIFRRDLYGEMGGMDELFNPFYEEDLDLGYRALKRGFKNIWVKECKVTLPTEKGVIETNISKTSFSKIAQRNQLLFIWKNINSPRLLADHQTALWKMVLGHPLYLPVILNAWKKKAALKRKKEREAKYVVLTDEEILGLFSHS